jgi:hypothetical protein
MTKEEFELEKRKVYFNNYFDMDRVLVFCEEFPECLDLEYNPEFYILNNMKSVERKITCLMGFSPSYNTNPYKSRIYKNKILTNLILNYKENKEYCKLITEVLFRKFPLDD